jgi:hypothetical protein
MKTYILIIMFVVISVLPGLRPSAVPAESTDAEIQAELQAAATPSLPPSLDLSVGERISSNKADSEGGAIYFSDFESDNGGMTGTLDWEWGVYNWVGDGCYNDNNVPPPSAHSGTRMWGTKLNTCYSDLGNNSDYSTCVNANKNDDSTLSFTVDLTEIDGAQLIWWEWYDVFGQWDWTEVYANDVTVFQKCGISYVAPTSWVKQVVDLTPFAGGIVTIEFHLMASTVVNFSGWFIDDVEVREVKKAMPFVPLLLLGD